MISIKLQCIIILCLFISANTYAGNEITNNDVEQFNIKETKLDAAAIELFFKLRDKYGQRFRTIGGLIYCNYNDLASKIELTKFELLIESDNLLDELDLTQYDISNISDKQRLNLYGRAVTAISAYIFAVNENSQFFTKMNPEYKDLFCKTMRNSYNEIIKDINH